MGSVPYKGSYEVWHEPPSIKTSLPDGTRLRMSFYHMVTVNQDQVMICPSEPKTVEVLRDEARRVHQLWGAKTYFMMHDEIRVLGWDESCVKRNLTPGAILADNVKTCARILRETAPGCRVLVWSDMFDPNHNAQGLLSGQRRYCRLVAGVGQGHSHRGLVLRQARGEHEVLFGLGQQDADRRLL